MAVVVIALLGALMPTATGATAAASESLYVISRPGTEFGQGKAWTYDPDPTLSATGNDTAVVVTNKDWSIDLRSASGSSLAVGWHTVTRDQTPGTGAWIDMIFDKNYGCGFKQGRFRVIQAPTFDGTGHVIGLAVDFEFGCDADAESLRGAIRIGSTTPVRLLKTTVPADFGSQIVGTTSPTATITVTNIGTVSVAIDDVTFEGDDPADFDSTADTCRGMTIAPGGSCTIGSRFVPTVTWKRKATARISDSSDLGSFVVPMTGTGVSPITLIASRLDVHSDPGDVVGEGMDSISDPVAMWAQGAPSQLWIGTSKWALVFRSANLQPLTPGTYEPVTSFGDLSDAAPAMSVYSGIGCGHSTGWFRVYEAPLIDVDDVTVLRFAADFEQFCDGSASGLRGSVRFHSTVPIPGQLTPSNVLIDGGATATRSTSVSVTTVATGAVDIALSNDGTAWATRPYGPVQTWTIPTGTGQKTVWVKWRDDVGNWTSPRSDSIVLDTLPPVATAPGRTFVVGSRMTAEGIPVRVGWSGADVGSGVDHYEVALSVDGAAYGAMGPITGTSVTRIVGTGHVYRFRVRAIDRASNTGAWSYGATFVLTVRQETSSAVRWSGTWRAAANTAYWGGHDRYATAAGAKASLTFTGHTFAWVGSVGPSRGWARVYVSGRLVKSINLHAATSASRRILFTTSWSTAQARTVTVRISGTPGHPRGDVDAFLVGS